MYLGRCLFTPVGGAYKIAIHGSCLCIHAFPNGVVPKYRTTWQLHLPAPATAPAPALGPRPRPPPAPALLLHSNVFEALSSVLAGLGRGWACPSPARNPIQQTGRRHKPMVQEGDGQATDQQSQAVTVITVRVITIAASPGGKCGFTAPWGRDGIWYLPPSSSAPSLHPPSPPGLWPLPQSVRRGPPAFRGLEEATSPFLPSPGLACLAVPARVLGAVGRGRPQAPSSGMCLTFDSRLTASPVFLDACNILCLIFPKNASSPGPALFEICHVDRNPCSPPDLHHPTSSTTTSPSWPWLGFVPTRPGPPFLSDGACVIRGKGPPRQGSPGTQYAELHVGYVPPQAGARPSSSTTALAHTRSHSRSNTHTMHTTRTRPYTRTTQHGTGRTQDLASSHLSAAERSVHQVEQSGARTARSWNKHTPLPQLPSPPTSGPDSIHRSSLIIAPRPEPVARSFIAHGQMAPSPTVNAAACRTTVSRATSFQGCSLWAAHKLNGCPGPSSIPTLETLLPSCNQKD